MFSTWGSARGSINICPQRVLRPLILFDVPNRSLPETESCAHALRQYRAKVVSRAIRSIVIRSLTVSPLNPLPGCGKSALGDVLCDNLHRLGSPTLGVRSAA